MKKFYNYGDRMVKFKCNVIVCGPGIGKTYLAMIDDRFIDIDGMRSDYKYNLYDLSYEDKEKGKGNRGEIINEDSDGYAIELLEQTIGDNKIALLSYNDKIIEYIIKNGIKYCLVYADIDLADEYAERMRMRGNNSKFVTDMTNKEIWEEFYNINVNDDKPTYKIKLQKGQYLYDIRNYFI